MNKFSAALIAALLFVTSAAHAAYNNPATPAGTNGQYQYNSNGTLAGGLPTSGSGAGLITGPLSSINGDLLNYTGTNGQAADSGISLSSVLTTASSIPGTAVTGNIAGNAANITGVCAIANGCTGATTAAGAQDNLDGNPGSGTSGVVARLANNSYTLVQNLTQMWCGNPSTAAFTPATCASFYGYYDLRWYGAKADGINVASVTATSGSTTISSPNGNWSSADIGKLITVPGAGASAGLPLNTTIATGSGTTATVASAAGTSISPAVFTGSISNYTLTVSSVTSGTIKLGQSLNGTSIGGNPKIVVLGTGTGGVGTYFLDTSASLASQTINAAPLATYGTSDTAAINTTMAAVAASSTGGGEIRMPDAITIVSGNSQFTAPNVSIGGYGYEGRSVLKYISTSDQAAAVFTGYSGTPSACTSAVALQLKGISIHDIEMDGSAATTNSGYTVNAKGIDIKCTTRSVLDRVFVHDFPATQIATDLGFPSIVRDTITKNCGRLSTGGAGGNCIGEGVFGYAGESYLLNNNHMTNPLHYGVYVESQVSGASVPAAVTENGNIVVGGYATTSNYAGIANSGIQGVVMSGNNVTGYVSTNTWYCYSSDNGTLGDSSGTDSVITGNYGQNCSQGLAISYSNISSNTISHTVVSGNHFKGNGTSGIAVTGSNSYTVDGLEFDNNESTDNGTAGIIFSGGTASFKNVSIIGGQYINNGAVTTSTWAKAGIAINEPIIGLNIAGVTAYDTGSGNQKYAFSINTGIAVTQGLMSGDHFANNATSALNMLGTFTGLIGTNYGFPTFTTSGACASTTPVGQGDVGSYLSGTTGSCVTTILPYGTANIIAPNGWSCQSSDLTTASDIITQSASTTTGCTLTGPTSSGDKIVFTSRPF